MSEVLSLFDTPIYQHTPSFDEVFLVQKEIKDVLDIVYANDSFENPEGWNDGVKTNIKARYNSIKDYKLKNLEKYIMTHVDKYTSRINAWMPAPVVLIHSWFNLTTHNEGQDWHQHQDSTISGCYYYQTSGADGDIVFKNPNPFTHLELFPFGGHTQKYYSASPAVGKIVLFPSWMEHKVNLNPTDTTRISIAFNLYRDNLNSELLASTPVEH